MNFGGELDGEVAVLVTDSMLCVQNVRTLQIRKGKALLDVGAHACTMSQARIIRHF